MELPAQLGETELVAWLKRIYNGETVGDTEKTTVILLLRLNLAVDDLTRTIRESAKKS